MVLLVLRASPAEAGVYVSEAMAATLSPLQARRIESEALASLRYAGVEAAVARGLLVLETEIAASGTRTEQPAGCATFEGCLRSFFQNPFSEGWHYALVLLVLLPVGAVGAGVALWVKHVRGQPKTHGIYSGGLTPPARQDSGITEPTTADDDDRDPVLSEVDLFPGSIAEYEAFRDCRVRVVDVGDRFHLVTVSVEDDGVRVADDDEEGSIYRALKSSRIKALVHARFDCDGNVYGLPVTQE